ncbi:hypothetical protein ACHMW6_29550 [Pseudoduganella sp. UC29_106]|uniref:hypothetical protein n=1 Tax=Pseudoduganella sp. UC29_106 TaxID=3374553 RepID=UPI003756B01C
MNPSEMNNFAKTLQRLSSQMLEETLPSIQVKYAELSTTRNPGTPAMARELINEAQIRQYVLDPLLASLGWDLTTPNTMLVEAPAEPSSDEGSRRFLDYLGQASTVEKEALLVVEAKRLSLELPTISDVPDSTSVCQALIAAVKKRPKVITKEWTEILCTLVDYAKRLSESNVGAPLRMALMNGAWIVVFLNPRKTLIEQRIESDDILVVADIADALPQVPALYANLAFGELSSTLPPQHFVNFGRLVAGNSGELEATFAVEVETGDIGSRPLMLLSESVAVKLPSGAWVRFRDGAKDPRVLRDDEEINGDMKEISQRTYDLFGKLSARRPLRLIEAAEYEAQQTKVLAFPSTHLLTLEGKGRYVWYLGKESAPIRDPKEHEGCPYHRHDAAQAVGMGQPDSAIRKRSIQPPVYFPNGSPYHCAHKNVHALRQERGCPIFYMEEQLCCRACSLYGRCWPEKTTDLPCVQSLQEEVDLLADYGPGVERVN